jgi:protein gp37
VPLVGTDLPDVSNLTYITIAGSTTVEENAARLIDENHVLYRSWSGDSMTHNAVLTNPDDSSQVPTSTRGFSMDKLKKCLNENGIAWAVLLVVGVACSAACATAVLCLPCVALYAGITGGALSKCVSYAFG